MDIVCPRCETAHEPIGIHEEDSGEWQCDNCGFLFVVEIEYEPEYSESCVEHNYGETREHNNRFYQQCIYCSHCNFDVALDKK